MGYTHYWDRPEVLPRKTFLAAAADCRCLCDALQIPLGGDEGKGQPTFTAQEICFNGHIDSGRWETFYVQRVRQPGYRHERTYAGWWSNFCKTNHQPYDLCVQGCLIVLSHHFTTSRFSVSSDGNSQAWNAARQACQRILGFGIDWGEDKLAAVAPSQPG